MNEMKHRIHILTQPSEFIEVEELQRKVWPGSDVEIVPSHLLISSCQHGGLCIGVYNQEKQLVGFVYGLPGIYATPDGPRLMHYSHMLGIHPDYRDQGLGFLLKRAQWQMVRKQGVDRITWTYDPLLSRNAHLNISKLGAVCSTYHIEYYGELRDGLNIGIPTDRFEVDWWVNSRRVDRKLSRQVRRQLDLAHYLAAEAQIINPSQLDDAGFALPGEINLPFDLNADTLEKDEYPALLLVEIPANFLELKDYDLAIALKWRIHTREIFTNLFRHGYLVTDFIYLKGTRARSMYVLSHGEQTL